MGHITKSIPMVTLELILNNLAKLLHRHYGNGFNMGVAVFMEFAFVRIR
jgi:hypothetical protein